MIAGNIKQIESQLPEGCKLIAVSKLKPDGDVMEAYAAGLRRFGENYPKELREKHDALPKDIEWHFIGHIQSKQIKYYIDFVAMIHGVDSKEHLQEIDEYAKKAGRVVDVLLQYHIGQEETKFGFGLDEVPDSSVLEILHNVRICGVMGMATFTDDKVEVRREFNNLKQVFDRLKSTVFAGKAEFREISMGMSDDYQIAVEEGSTIVRVGSKIFGARDYSEGKYAMSGQTPRLSLK